MRGALESLPGVKHVAVQAGNRNMGVVYDPAAVTVDAMLVALANAKEPAARR